MEIRKCILCGENDSIEKSHVFPEFMYKKMYDDKHRIFLHGNDLRERGLRQKGFYEPLMCYNCEQHVGNNIENACSVFFSKMPDSLIGANAFEANIPRELKLLVLSMIYRSHYCMDSDWNMVQLNQSQLDYIKDAILNLKYENLDYDVWMYVPLLEREVLKGFISPPQDLKSDGNRLIHFIAGGIQWIIRIETNGLGIRQSPIVVGDKYIVNSVDIMKSTSILGLFGLDNEESAKRIYGDSLLIYVGDSCIGKAADVIVNKTVDDNGYIYTEFTASIDEMDPATVKIGETVSIYDEKEFEYIIRGSCVEAGFHVSAGNFTIIKAHFVHAVPKK